MSTVNLDVSYGARVLSQKGHHPKKVARRLPLTTCTEKPALGQFWDSAVVTLRDIK